MQVFTSRPIELNKDINTLFRLISKPSNLQPLIEKVGDKVEDYRVAVTEEQVSFFLPALGEVVVKLTDVVPPNVVRYETIKSPVPLTLQLNLSGEGEGKTLGQISAEADIPPFLIGMVKGKVEGALAKVANMLESIDLSEYLG